MVGAKPWRNGIRITVALFDGGKYLGKLLDYYFPGIQGESPVQTIFGNPPYSLMRNDKIEKLLEEYARLKAEELRSSGVVDMKLEHARIEQVEFERKSLPEWVSIVGVLEMIQQEAKYLYPGLYRSHIPKLRILCMLYNHAFERVTQLWPDAARLVFKLNCEFDPDALKEYLPTMAEALKRAMISALPYNYLKQLAKSGKISMLPGMDET